METRSIADTESDIIEEFSFFPDWQDRYEYIIELGKKLNELPPEHHVNENKVKGCQSNVWLVSDFENGKINFAADSDSVIVKGLIALLIRVLSGRTPDEILGAKLEFIDAIGLKQHLAGTRANGLASMIKQIKIYALAYKAKQEQLQN